MPNTKCGYIAIIGKPNVGKSTLLNCILGQKVSITTSKPQTTRHQLLGIKTTDNIQFLYVDTPGIHQKTEKAINRYMNRAAKSVIRDVDVVVWVLDRNVWTGEDEFVADLLKNCGAKLIIAINKTDKQGGKEVLLPHMASLAKRLPKAELVPISAKKGHNIEKLESLVSGFMPEDHFYFPDEQITDRSEKFLVAELIREKMMRNLGEELPYELTIQIQRFSDSGKSIHIDATTFVEREGQKGIIVGKKGSKLKQIASDARKEIEVLLGRKVMLNIWVKVKSGWSDDERALKSLGYDDL